jgi:hypothetical protein
MERSLKIDLTTLRVLIGEIFGTMSDHEKLTFIWQHRSKGILNYVPLYFQLDSQISSIPDLINDPSLDLVKSGLQVIGRPDSTTFFKELVLAFHVLDQFPELAEYARRTGFIEGVMIGLDLEHCNSMRSLAIGVLGVFLPTEKKVVFCRGGSQPFTAGRSITNVFLHEFGHAVDFSLDKTSRREFSEISWNLPSLIESALGYEPVKKSNFLFVSSYAETNPLEDFAEQFSTFISSPSAHEKTYPTQSHYFRRLMTCLTSENVESCMRN